MDPVLIPGILAGAAAIYTVGSLIWNGVKPPFNKNGEPTDGIMLGSSGSNRAPLITNEFVYSSRNAEAPVPVSELSEGWAHQVEKALQKDSAQDDYRNLSAARIRRDKSGLVVKDGLSALVFISQLAYRDGVKVSLDINKHKDRLTIYTHKSIGDYSRFRGDLSAITSKQILDDLTHAYALEVVKKWGQQIAPGESDDFSLKVTARAANGAVYTAILSRRNTAGSIIDVFVDYSKDASLHPQDAFTVSLANETRPPGKLKPRKDSDYLPKSEKFETFDRSQGGLAKKMAEEMKAKRLHEIMVNEHRQKLLDEVKRRNNNWEYNNNYSYSSKTVKLQSRAPYSVSGQSAMYGLREALGMNENSHTSATSGQRETVDPRQENREQWDRLFAQHDEGLDTWAEYELNLEMALKYPLVTDVSNPLVMSMLRAMNNAGMSRPSQANEDKSPMGTPYSDAVIEFTTTLRSVIHAAKKAAWSGFTTEERKRLDKASQMLRMAQNAAASPHERQVAYRRVLTEIEGLIILPETPLAALEASVMKGITSA